MDLDLTDAQRAHVLARVERIWGSTDRDTAPALAAVPRALPAGTVVRLSSGGPFGWLLDARLDEVDGELMLEVLEDSRMAGPDHYRLRADGTHEQLPTVRTGMAFPKDATPDERAAIARDYFAHNRRVGEQLRERGFR